jgi:hypothetical protein
MNDQVLDVWHCPLGVDFAYTVGEMGTSCHHASFAIHVFVKHWNVWKFFGCYLVIGLCYTISRTFSCTTFMRCIENLGKHSTIRNSLHNKLPTVFFTTLLQCHYQQSEQPTDTSHWFTWFRKWYSMARDDNIGCQIQTTVQWNSSILETVWNRTHHYIRFLLRMTNIITSQNTDLPFLDTP